MLSKFDGVAHEVHEDLAQPAWIAAQPEGHLVMNQRRQFQVFGAGAFGEEFEGVLNRFGHVEVLHFKSQFARLDPGEIEDVIDDREQGFGAAADGFGKVALFGSEMGLQQQIGHADDAIHGRADFVAHHGQKLALGTVGTIGGDGQLTRMGDGVLQLSVRRSQLAIGCFGRGL